LFEINKMASLEEYDSDLEWTYNPESDLEEEEISIKGNNIY